MNISWCFSVLELECILVSTGSSFLLKHNNPSQSVLKENRMKTVEPGSYIQNGNVVRIPDQESVAGNGYEDLLSTTHELIEL